MWIERGKENLFLIFFNEVKVVLLDGNCMGYFSVVDSFGKDVFLDRNIFSEGVFFVDVCI